MKNSNKFKTAYERKIVFNLKRQWYDLIASGEKKCEYRRVCRHWARRFMLPWPINDHDMAVLRIGLPTYLIHLVAVFRLGYGRQYPDIKRRIVFIDVGECPYPGWDGEYFRISLGKLEE